MDNIYNQLPEYSKKISKYEEIRPLICLPIESTEFRQPSHINLTILWINKKLGLGYGLADNSITLQINWYLFGSEIAWENFNKNIARQFENDLT